MTNKEVKPFQPSDIMEGVKAKIKASFVDLIPDDAWEAMVQTQIDEFWKDTKKSGYGGYNTKVAGIKPMIDSLLSEFMEAKIKEKLSEYFSSKEFEEKWEKEGQTAIEGFMKEAIVNNAGQVIYNMVANAFQGHARILSANFETMLNNRQY